MIIHLNVGGNEEQAQPYGREIESLPRLGVKPDRAWWETLEEDPWYITGAKAILGEREVEGMRRGEAMPWIEALSPLLFMGGGRGLAKTLPPERFLSFATERGSIPLPGKPSQPQSAEKIITEGTRRFGSDARAKESIESANRTIAFYTKGKGMAKIEAGDPSSHQFLQRAMADKAIAEKYIADPNAVKYNVVNPPKQKIPKWNKDEDVAEYFRNDIAKEMAKQSELSKEQIDKLINQHLLDEIGNHRAEMEGEVTRMGHEFWDEAAEDLAGRVLEH